MLRGCLLLCSRFPLSATAPGFTLRRCLARPTETDIPPPQRTPRTQTGGATGIRGGSVGAGQWGAEASPASRPMRPQTGTARSPLFTPGAGRGKFSGQQGKQGGAGAGAGGRHQPIQPQAAVGARLGQAKAPPKKVIDPMFIPSDLLIDDDEDEADVLPGRSIVGPDSGKKGPRVIVVDDEDDNDNDDVDEDENEGEEAEGDEEEAEEGDDDEEEEGAEEDDDDEDDDEETDEERLVDDDEDGFDPDVDGPSGAPVMRRAPLGKKKLKAAVPVQPKRKFAPSGELRMNERIDAPKITLVGLDGKRLGEYTVRTAISMARAKDKRFNVVEVVPNANPPICRIVDPVEQEAIEKKRRLSERKKLEKDMDAGRMKELRFGSKIAEHDLQIKVRKLQKFLLKKRTVKCSITFQRDEMDADLANDYIDHIYQRVEPIAKKSEYAQTVDRRHKTIAVIFLPKATVKIDDALKAQLNELNGWEDWNDFDQEEEEDDEE